MANIVAYGESYLRMGSTQKSKIMRGEKERERERERERGLTT